MRFVMRFSALRQKWAESWRSVCLFVLSIFGGKIRMFSIQCTRTWCPGGLTASSTTGQSRTFAFFVSLCHRT